MGLRWVLVLAEVSSFPSKSQDSPFSLEVICLEVKSCRVLPAISGRASSETDLAGDRHVAAHRCQAPWDLLPRGLDRSTTCLRAATSRPIGPGPMILCGNHSGCPISMRSWLMTKGVSCQLIMGEMRN
jgi:hypothetical protein